MGCPGIYRMDSKVASAPSGMHRSGVMFGLGISLPTERNSTMNLLGTSFWHPVNTKATHAIVKIVRIFFIIVVFLELGCKSTKIKMKFQILKKVDCKKNPAPIGAGFSIKTNVSVCVSVYTGKTIFVLVKTVGFFNGTILIKGQFCPKVCHSKSKSLAKTHDLIFFNLCI